ncbi:hypothetical protein BC831DRAFT_470308 [Entophlyctis helioformis]|nr:hypothetical protein BC831DRAFT_470308 [Entophlyctis helioformis]
MDVHANRVGRADALANVSRVLGNAVPLVARLVSKAVHLGDMHGKVAQEVAGAALSWADKRRVSPLKHHGACHQWQTALKSHRLHSSSTHSTECISPYQANNRRGDACHAFVSWSSRGTVERRAGGRRQASNRAVRRVDPAGRRRPPVHPVAGV